MITQGSLLVDLGYVDADDLIAVSAAAVPR